MMKILLYSFFFTALFSLHSCYQIKTTVDHQPYSYSVIKKAKETVTQKVGVPKVVTPDSIDTFISGETLYGLKFILQSKAIDSTDVTIMTFSPSEKVAGNLNKSFRSFLQQELDKEYVKQNRDNFYSLKPKSKDEYIKRNWIFMAYGIDYLGKDNPYSNKADNNIGKALFGICEIAQYAGIIGGPFFGKSKKDKVMIPLINLAGLVAWKLMLPWLEGNKQIDSYNEIANSGYLIPIDVR